MRQKIVQLVNRLVPDKNSKSRNAIKKLYYRTLHTKRAAVIALGRVSALLLSLLPFQIKVATRERLNPSHSLDYKKHDIRIYTDSLRETSSRIHSCQKEPETIAWIETAMAPGDVFYDIGANIGAYSLVAAAFHRCQVTVYAFEPGFANFYQLCRNIHLNAFDHAITPLAFALSDRTQMEEFLYRSIGTGDASHTLAGASTTLGNQFKPAYRQKMPAYRLDDIIETFKLPLPHHLKIDVDGAELLVLQGAQSTLASSTIKSVLIETIDEPTRSTVTSMMTDVGLTKMHTHLKAGGKGPSANCIFTRP